MDAQRNVVIFCEQLLPPSETFVLQQSESLRAFTPIYVGRRWTPGLTVPSERSFVLDQGNRRGRVADLAFRLTGLAPQLAVQVRRRAPALIHAHFGPAGVWALPLARAAGVPLVTTFHGYDATLADEHLRRGNLGERLYLKRRWRLASEARLCIAASEFIRSKLLQKGFAPERTIVHYIGVDVEKFRRNPGVAREPAVLFVGRLVKNKGADLLIRAMGKVQARLPHVELVLIGDGPERESLEQLAKRELRRCRFLGTQPPENVRAWMSRAQVFCVPSVPVASGASEGLGIVFLEAQAMELPVVSFATGGIPEAVRHEETGMLAPSGDWEALARHLEALLADEDRRNALSARGRAWVRERFDLARQTRALEELYRSVARGSSESLG